MAEMLSSRRRLRRRVIDAARAHRLVAAAVVSAAGLVLPLFRWQHMADFRVYRRAAGALVRGADVYARSPVHPLAFTYPAFAAVFVAPIALLPAVTASVLMTVLSIVSGLFVVTRMLPTDRIDALHRAIVPALVVALMWTEPMRVTLRLGQINVILMALVVADATGFGRRLPRGALTGIAAGVKLTPGVFVLYALAIRRLRPALVALGVFAATVLIGVVVQPSSTQYWTSLLWDTNRVGDVAGYGNQSLLAVSTRLVGAGLLSRALWVAAGGVAVAVGLRVAARLHREGNTVLALGVVGVVSTLVSPISWTHHWVWCVVVFAGLLHRRPTYGRGAYVWAAAWLAVFEVGPNTPLAHLAFHDTVTRVVVGNDYVLAGLALIAALAWRTADAPGRDLVTADKGVSGAGVAGPGVGFTSS